MLFVVFLQMPDPVQLTVYANGILMFSGPFRPFSDPETQAFMQDVLDGYFPSELQKRYPDGVPFNVSTAKTPQKRPNRIIRLLHVILP
jgi:hypothetical protein